MMQGRSGMAAAIASRTAARFRSGGTGLQRRRTVRGMRNATRWAALALLLVLAPACGDDDDSSSSDTTAGGATETTAAGGGGGEDACAASGEGEAVTIADFAFDPDTVTVASGGVVSVSNDDGTTHTFTSDDGGFDCEISGGE